MCHYLLLVLLCISAAANRFVEGELILIYSVARHGARNILPKSAILQESSQPDGDPLLLPEGQRQCYNAGNAFRKRYLESPTCNSTCLMSSGGQLYGDFGAVGVGFNGLNTQFKSSGLRRTIMSAYSFLTGAFPPVVTPTNTTYLPTGQQVIPVTSTEDSDDVLIRAYAKCPAYQSALKKWFASEEFNVKAQDSAALRAQVQQLAPALNTSLPNWWNVYDSFNVWRTYGVGEPMPAIDDQTFQEVKQLAYWLETSKMRYNLTRNLLGGPMIGDILHRMGVAANNTLSGSATPYPMWMHISSHYNTQLGLLSALSYDMWPRAGSNPWVSGIPATAAMLVLELHSGASSALAVRLVLQDGPASAAGYIGVTLPCAEEGSAAELLAGSGACSYEDFVDLLSPQAMTTAEEWCSACNNTASNSCIAAQVETLSIAPESESSGNAAAWQIGVSVALSFVGGVALGLAGLAAVNAWRRRRGKRPALAAEDYKPPSSAELA